jgi:hypothetical protein
MFYFNNFMAVLCNGSFPIEFKSGIESKLIVWQVTVNIVFISILAPEGENQTDLTGQTDSYSLLDAITLGGGVS